MMWSKVEAVLRVHGGLSCKPSGLQPHELGTRCLVVGVFFCEGELLRGFLWRRRDVLVSRKPRLLANAGIGWITRGGGRSLERPLRIRHDWRPWQSAPVIRRRYV